MKKIFYSIWIPLSCAAVMILTGVCILAFYMTIAFRKIFIKDFTPNVHKDSVDEAENAPIESATSHLNAIKATLDKTGAQHG